VYDAARLGTLIEMTKEDPSRVRRAAATLAWQAALVFLAALAVRLLDAGRPPVHHDELYHILAARSYLSEGTFRIWSGEYLRASAFTALVGWSLGFLGDTLFGARFPSVVSGALLVAAGFVWVHRVTGAASAWTFALMLGISSFALHISHFSRFYALHGLLFFLGAIALYAFVRQPRGASRFLILLLGISALTGALYLQRVTLIGIAGLAVWLAAYVIWQPQAQGMLKAPKARLVIAGVGIPAALAIVWLLYATGVIGALYSEYRWAALWNADIKDNSRFYVHHFAGDLPLLFYLFPVAALLALSHAPRPAFFCLTIAAVSLVLHSFAGMKGERYVYYTYPFVFTVGAIAVAVLFLLVKSAAANVIARIPLLTRRHLPARAPQARPAGRLAGSVLGATLALAVLVALAGNPDFATVRSVPAAAVEAAMGRSRTSIALAEEARTQAALRKVVDQHEILVSSNELAALYFLGRFDLTVRASRLDEMKSTQEFARDPRTGGPVIGTAASLERVVGCYSSGTLLVWGRDWGIEWAISPDMVKLVEASMQEVKLPGTLRVRAFEWNHAASNGLGCEPVRQALRHAARASGAAPAWGLPQ
jgi:hypothetical protein